MNASTAIYPYLHPKQCDSLCLMKLQIMRYVIRPYRPIPRKSTERLLNKSDKRLLPFHRHIGHSSHGRHLRHARHWRRRTGVKWIKILVNSRCWRYSGKLVLLEVELHVRRRHACRTPSRDAVANIIRGAVDGSTGAEGPDPIVEGAHRAGSRVRAGAERSDR